MKVRMRLVALVATAAIALAVSPVVARGQDIASLSYTYDGDYLTVTATVASGNGKFYGVGIQCEDELGNQTFPENDPGGYMALGPYPLLWGPGTATTAPRFISPTSTAPPNVSVSPDPWGHECYVAIWRGTNYRQVLAWFEFDV